MADRPRAVPAAWNDGPGAAVAKRLAQLIGVVAAVGDKAVEANGMRDQAVRAADIRDVARRDRQRGRAAEEIADRVDLGRAAAARDTDRLRLCPPLPPAAERCAFT